MSIIKLGSLLNNGRPAFSSDNSKPQVLEAFQKGLHHTLFQDLRQVFFTAMKNLIQFTRIKACGAFYLFPFSILIHSYT
jgi:hypothetical protein